MTEHVGDLLSAWLDGELPADEVAAVAAHVDACPACAFEHDEVAGGRAALRGLAMIDPPEAVLRPRPAVHPGDALSALVDAELGPEEHAIVAAHVDACAACAGELEEIVAARSAVRRLPRLDPPPGVLRPPSSGSTGSGRRVALVGAAAAAVGLVGLLVSAQPVVAEQPAIAALVDAHARAAAPAPRVQQLSLGSLGRPAAQAEAPSEVPGTLSPGFRLVSVRRSHGQVHATYRDDDHALSLFRRPAGTSPVAAPQPGAPVAVGETRGYEWIVPDGVVVAWSSGGVGYAIVTDGSAEDAVAAAASVPAAGAVGLLERTRARCRGVLDRIG